MDKVVQSYELLGLPENASSDEVRQAYRDLVRIWHPDRFENEARLQKRAQEKLKEINEAYAVVRQELAGRKLAVNTSSNTETASNKSAVEQAEPPPEKHPYKAKTSVSTSARETGISLPLFPFFSSWQNILFLLLVYAALHHASTRFGTISAGAAYVMMILVLPITLAVICNSPRFSSVRLLWASYLAVISVSGSYLLFDAIKFNNDLTEAANSRGYLSQELPAGTKIYGTVAPVSPYDAIDVQRGGSRGRTAGPVMPAVPLPEAPTAPTAPLVPTVPIVSPAR